MIFNDFHEFYTRIYMIFKVFEYYLYTCCVVVSHHQAKMALTSKKVRLRRTPWVFRVSMDVPMGVTS